VELDEMGNVIATSEGDPDAPEVILAAHTDDLAMLVDGVTDESFLDYQMLGAITRGTSLASKSGSPPTWASRSPAGTPTRQSRPYRWPTRTTRSPSSRKQSRRRSHRATRFDGSEVYRVPPEPRLVASRTLPIDGA
jgi:hypothetical protein